MKEADDAVRAKYGLSGPDFSALDRADLVLSREKELKR